MAKDGMKLIIDIVKTVWVVSCWLLGTSIIWFPIFITGFLSKTGRVSFKLCQAWVWVAKFVTFAKVEKVSKVPLDKSKSYVIVSNHQSLLDIPVLMLHMGVPFRWVLKKELGYVPMFGWALWGARHILVDRSKPKLALKNMNKAIKKLSPGVSIAIFPEGTRSESGELGDFKIGGFLTALSAGLPILPVTINGSHKRMPSKKSLSFNPGKIQLVIGEPIDTSQYSRRQISKLMQDAKAAVAANLNSAYPE